MENLKTNFYFFLVPSSSHDCIIAVRTPLSEPVPIINATMLLHNTFEKQESAVNVKPRSYVTQYSDELTFPLLICNKQENTLVLTSKTSWIEEQQDLPSFPKEFTFTTVFSISSMFNLLLECPRMGDGGWSLKSKHSTWSHSYVCSMCSFDIRSNYRGDLPQEPIPNVILVDV